MFPGTHAALEPIAVDTSGHGFIHAKSKTPFIPWGHNYGNQGRLMEDFWEQDWKTFADDFREMKAMGANVVRVHLQFGYFMAAADKPRASAFAQLFKMLRLAEETGVYLDLTGLACYRTNDVPKWYDAANDEERWNAQAVFWQAVAECSARSPAVFCYDLMNEPISPGKQTERKWYTGKFGDYSFIQFIAQNEKDQPREAQAVAWIERMTAAIRSRDPSHLITVGMLPWGRVWGHLSGFIPAQVSAKLDFLSVHLYPDRANPGEAMEALQKCAGTKPVVIEETFPLSCSVADLEVFLRESRGIACGWIGHYDGTPLAELTAFQRAGKLTLPQAFMRDWLQLFVRLQPEFTSTRR